MTHIWIPTKHQSAAKTPTPHQSGLRKAYNKVMGVKHVNGQPVHQKHVMTENFSMGLSQSLLEEAQESRAGRFLLELLGAVDYAGKQRRPVMLIGRKVQAGGMKVTVVVPVDLSLQPGQLDGLSVGDGITQEG